MRKFICILLVLIMSMSVSACGAQQESNVINKIDVDNRLLETVEGLEEQTQEDSLQTDWSKYKLSYNGGLTVYKNKLFYDNFHCQAEVLWIRDLTEEKPFTKEQVASLLGRCFTTKIGQYCGWYKGTQYILSDDSYQFCINYYPKQSLYWTIEDWIYLLENLNIQKGSYLVNFTVTREETVEAFQAIMSRYDAILKYVDMDYTKISLNELNTVLQPCEVLCWDEDGNPKSQKQNVLYAEVTEDVWGYTFPWKSTGDIKKDILNVFCDLETGWQLSSDLLMGEPPAFQDIDGKLYFSTIYRGGTHLKRQNTLWNYESIELLDEKEGVVYFYIQDINKNTALHKIVKNTEGQWVLADNFI